MAKVKLLSRSEARKAEQQQIHRLQQQQKAIEARLGRTAVEELAWITGLSQATLRDEDALAEWEWLDFFAKPALRHIVIVTRIPEDPNARTQLVADIRAVLQTVKTLINGLADGREVNLSPESGDLTFSIRQDAKGRLQRGYRGTLEAQVFLRTLDLLDTVGCDRLRRCPYLFGGKLVCERLFVKRKGQRFCCRQHAQKAAYDAWVKRGRPRWKKGGKTR